VKAWGVAAGLAGVVLAGVVGSSWGADAEASLSERCAAYASASESRHAAVAGTGTRVAVIGDSYSQGLRLDDPTASWPSRLDGRVVVDGFAGSGFGEDASPCEGRAYHRRVDRALATDPDLVVVQGGLNDFDVPSAQVRAGARRVLAQLEGQEVVLVGPPSAPRRAKGAERVDAVLSEVAEDAGMPYVRTLDWRLEYLDDRLHLTPAGHRAFGDQVAAAIATLDTRQ
jgi:acyl-CoA thioesterase-1